MTDIVINENENLLSFNNIRESGCPVGKTGNVNKDKREAQKRGYIVCYYATSTTLKQNEIHQNLSYGPSCALEAAIGICKLQLQLKLHQLQLFYVHYFTLHTTKRSISIRLQHICSGFSAYRDPNEEIAEVSSLGSKDGMSEVDVASGGENYLDKDPNKLKFVDHYAHDPKHESWRTTFDNQDDAAKAKYDEYTSQVVALPDDFEKPRFKSFSSLENFPVPPPPAYESHPEDDVDHCYAELPTEAVTSFMSPEYEAKKTRSLGRPKSAMTRHAPSDSDEELDRQPRRGYGSQSQLDQFSPRKIRDDLRQPHRGSREHFDPSYHRKPRTDGFSYATMPHPRHLKQNEIYQNISQSPSGHEADVSSEMSSSSNGDQRTPGRYPLRGVKPPRYPKPEYLKDPTRRRNRPPNLIMPSTKYPDHSTSSDSPTSPISPAPSYHSNEEYDASRYRTLPSRIPPPLEYADGGEPEPVYQNTLPRRIEPTVIIRHGRSQEHIEENEVHISPYQSFV